MPFIRLGGIPDTQIKKYIMFGRIRYVIKLSIFFLGGGFNWIGLLYFNQFPLTNSFEMALEEVCMGSMEILIKLII